MRRNGFTLVELLVVVTILAILFASVVPRLTGRADQARRARAESDIASISLALDLFETDTGKYPETLDALRVAPSTDVENWHGPYLKQEPVDPWKHPYRYVFPGTHNNQDYDLLSPGSDGAEGTADDIANWGKEEK